MVQKENDIDNAARNDRVTELRDQRRKLHTAHYLSEPPMSRDDYLDFKAEVGAELLEVERE